MTEAYFAKKTLMENNWNPDSLIKLEKIKKEFYNKPNKSKKLKIPKYCPKCGNKLKDKTKICPYCGIHVDEY
ncbi:zinc ribbon domain-containing protein [Methanobrevibacter sp. 87.7]|uniref:zinc ribbon domain-containing protein n=1 Tax=Methanobrevibacter sp. 87.7 TaxID=387957 RepID=UPI001E5E51B0|nr:zinc ribbon domain-containing protein [Methanobrevibacter sp. 87.7]